MQMKVMPLPLTISHFHVLLFLLIVINYKVHMGIIFQWNKTCTKYPENP